MVFAIIIAVSSGAHAQDTPHPNPAGVVITPAQLSYQLCGAQSIDETISITLPARERSRINQMDVLFLVDISGSMRDVLNTVKASSSALAAQFQRLIPDTRLGVGVFSDYVDVPWDLISPFSGDGESVQRQLTSISLRSGGDNPESYGRALWEANQLDWRTNAVKIVVLFTDAPPHTRDRGRDKRFYTDDDLFYDAVLAELAESGIRVIGIDSGSAGELLRQASTITQGAYLRLSDSAQLSELVMQAITGELNELRPRFYPVEEQFRDWFSQTPESIPYPDEGITTQVHITFSPAQHFRQRTSQNFVLQLTEGQTHYGTVSIQLDYLPRCDAVMIADSPQDSGENCTPAPFWQSPAIIIRPQADGGTDSLPIQVGEVHAVYVQVHNIGFQPVRDITVTLQEADGLLSEHWTPVGQHIITELPADSQTWAGPFRWLARSKTVALGASLRLAAPSDPEPSQAYACNPYEAQRRETILALDNFSLSTTGSPIGLLNSATLGLEGRIRLTTEALQTGEFIRMPSGRPAHNRILSITADQPQTLAFSSILPRIVHIEVIENSSVTQGASLLLQPAIRAVAAPNEPPSTSYGDVPSPLIPLITSVVIAIIILAVFIRSRIRP
jgi:hypothetical protein